MASLRGISGLNVLSPYFGGRAYLSIQPDSDAHNLTVTFQSPCIKSDFRLLCFSCGVQTIKPHVPLIKFRKGGLPDARAGQAAAQPSSGGSGRKGTVVRATIEDYQLPLKYRRQPLDDKEIDYINRGGPE